MVVRYLSYVTLIDMARHSKQAKHEEEMESIKDLKLDLRRAQANSPKKSCKTVDLNGRLVNKHRSSLTNSTLTLTITLTLTLTLTRIRSQ